VRLYSRNSNDWTVRLAVIAGPLDTIAIAGVCLGLLPQLDQMQMQPPPITLEVGDI
jgi:hypothetical protein